jgi:hypothetical protein
MFHIDARFAYCLVFATACSANSLSVEDEGADSTLSIATGAAVGSTCGLSQPAFCDTFDAPAGNGNRAGQLNGVVWGVSRSTGNNDLGQHLFDAWGETALQACDGTRTVRPENDVIICNGQVREAVNDLHTVTTLAMYPKQPFDFAGRTGVVTFDVSNDTRGSHAEWPEFWISDLPVPAPFAFQGKWLAAPRHAFGVRFSAAVGPHQGPLLSPNCPNDGNERWSAGSAVAVRNFVMDDQDAGGTIRAQVVGCVTRASGPGQMNHVEIRISQSQVDIYATDAGTTTPLKRIAVINNANLSFTRGLIWIEDAHYNAEKGNGQTQHTFAWDNVGFDGPVLARDLAFDAPDALESVSSYPGQVNLGWLSMPNKGRSFTVGGVQGQANAAAAFLTFNFYHYDPPRSLTYTVNGHSHTLSWPYPDTQGYTTRTLAAPVPLTDIVTGSNAVNIWSEQALVVSNVDLILAGAGGVVAP